MLVCECRAADHCGSDGGGQRRGPQGRLSGLLLLLLPILSLSVPQKLVTMTSNSEFLTLTQCNSDRSIHLRGAPGPTARPPPRRPTRAVRPCPASTSRPPSRYHPPPCSSSSSPLPACLLALHGTILGHVRCHHIAMLKPPFFSSVTQEYMTLLDRAYYVTKVKSSDFLLLDEN